MQTFFEHSNSFLPLPNPLNIDKKPRLTGFEFEYTGISVSDCAELLAHEFEGESEEESPLVYYVNSTPLGRIKVEADWHVAQKIANHDWKEMPARLASYFKQATATLSKTSTFPVPWEIVTEPLHQEKFELLEKLRALLCKNQAEGVSDAPIYAFGAHINCEIPCRDIPVILDYLRAFLILYPTLLRQLSVHPSRRLLTYIAPFPDDYAKKILAPNYRPNEKTFIKDYLSYNNTRNRALDMLPLICHLCPETLDQIKKSSKKLIKPRPAFHYRLPNCDFGNESWRVSTIWNSWVAVERLAEDKEKLYRLSCKLQDELAHPWKKWIKRIFKI